MITNPDINGSAINIKILSAQIYAKNQNRF